MIKRFEGEGGRDRLIEALRRQVIVQNDEQLATELADIAELSQIEPSSRESEFIKQDAIDNDLYLIVVGKVSIRVGGREVAIRETGQHVGEMALIDITARRAASVVVLTQTVLARVTERKFTLLANRRPILWRRLAIELGNRLRERGKHIRPLNKRSVVFIGSSAEQRAIAFEIRDGLSPEDMLVKVWTDDIFRASSITVETLERKVQEADLAVMVVTPDDFVVSRDKETPAARDNVVWEHSLFTGVLGRRRTVLVRPRNVEINIPSDLLGITPLDYPAQATAQTFGRGLVQ
jgi:CRP/FNR family cyclic AMP-dependent transcriptional regulator